MTLQQLNHLLLDQLKQQRLIFTFRDFLFYFPNVNRQSLRNQLSKHLKEGNLLSIQKGIYMNPVLPYVTPYAREWVVDYLRPDDYSYVSLETMAAEYGLISQQPLAVLTMITNGRAGIVDTPVGRIEFTHTSRPLHDLVAGADFQPHRGVNVANREQVVRDLYEAGRAELYEEMQHVA